MTGTSRWIFHIDNMFMKQDITAQIEIGDDGEISYYAVTSKGLRPFPKDFTNKISWNGDTMAAAIEIEQLKGMKLKVEIDFEQDSAEGFFKIPIIGKLKFGGEKIEVTELPILPEKTADEFVDNAKDKVFGDKSEEEQ